MTEDIFGGGDAQKTIVLVMILRIACINIQDKLVCQINLFGLLIRLLRNDLACLSCVKQPEKERKIERALH
jgi:hypothetical protein